MTEKSIHVWLGFHSGGDEDWVRYFGIEVYGSQCGFCIDTRTEWFDLDKFSVYNAGSAIPVQDIVIEVPFSDQFEDEFLHACSTFRIDRASHCFTLIDFDGSVRVGSQYNGSTLVGVFDFSA